MLSFIFVKIIQIIQPIRIFFKKPNYLILFGLTIAFFENGGQSTHYSYFSIYFHRRQTLALINHFKSSQFLNTKNLKEITSAQKKHF